MKSFLGGGQYAFFKILIKGILQSKIIKRCMTWRKEEQRDRDFKRFWDIESLGLKINSCGYREFNIKHYS